MMFKRRPGGRATDDPSARSSSHLSTIALVAGVHPKVVQERLATTSINITLDTYSHVVQGLQRDAAEQIADLDPTHPLQVAFDDLMLGSAAAFDAAAAAQMLPLAFVLLGRVNLKWSTGST